MSEYIDMHTHEILDDDDMHARYDQWLDEIYPEVEIGHSTFNPSEILKELEPITYRVGFSDFENFAAEDNSIMDLDDCPPCEECGEKMDRDEVVTALEDHDRLVCESCGDEDDDEDDDYGDVCYASGTSRTGAHVVCTMSGDHETHVAMAYADNQEYEITGVIWG